MPNILISGLPGKMATLVAERLINGTYHVIRDSLTGPNQSDIFAVNGLSNFALRAPEEHEDLLSELKELEHNSVEGLEYRTVAIDFSQLDAANRNAKLFCKYEIPFVMGTTGGDREDLMRVVMESGNTAVIAPNMAHPVVLMQTMLEQMARESPNALEGYTLRVVESHQAGKKDTSGTAKAMVNYFRDLGVVLRGDIIKVRNPGDQLDMGVPSKDLGGHGWHTYTVRSPDGNVLLEFRHNVNGRQPYVDGTMKALDFLVGKLDETPSRERGEGKVYTMMDVLRGK